MKAGDIGELCLSGVQLTSGYLKNPERNKQAFFSKEIDGEMIRFYRSGDLCSVDQDDNILFSGRLDQQVKVQGFRVELAEIEHHAKHSLAPINAIAIARTDGKGGNTIEVIIEQEQVDIESLINDLKAHLPDYMLPKKVHTIPVFPLNSNGKIDRKKLTEQTKA